jgi:hypothetical protein
MFNLFNRSQRRRYPTIREALVESGLAAAGDPKRVAVLENHGQYAGRRVNFFRAFESGHRDLVLGSGHVEHEGTVVVDSRPAPEGATPTRELANRAMHVDDERLVFWDAARARLSEATLSAPAATWQHARSTSISGATAS